MYRTDSVFRHRGRSLSASKPPGNKPAGNKSASNKPSGLREHGFKLQVQKMQDSECQPSVAETAQQADAAIAASRLKDEFLAMLGHELRNSLAPIRAALDLMRLQGTHSREQDIIERQVGHLVRQVDDLLDISRIAGGKIALRCQPIELRTVITQAIEITGPLLKGREHQLEIQVAALGLVVDADPARLAQVFSNLLSNAAKYSDAGSRIVIAAARCGDNVRVCVRDHGVGIAPDMLDQVFGLFVQQRQTLDRARGGLGLGLTIVRRLIEVHGGTITVRSAGLDQGSEFIVELPAHDGVVAGSVSEPALAPLRTAAAPSGRILIVDDNTDAAEMLQCSLTALGYTVAVASDGFAALRLAPSFVPDVALIDIGLPRMGGCELAQKLRESGALPQLQLVALTGYGHAADFERSAAAGFTRHLVKPVELSKLDRLLKKLGA